MPTASELIQLSAVECIRRWKFVLSVIALIAVAGLIFALLQPRSFVSITPLILDPTKAAVFESYAKSMPSLERVVTVVPDIPGQTRADKHDWLVKNISIDTGSKHTAIQNLRVAGRTPEEAKKIATAILDSTLALMKPRPVAAERLEKQLVRIESQLRDADTLIARLQSEAKSVISPNSNSGEIATSLAKLLERRDGFIEAADQIRNQIQGGGRDVILAAPSLSDQPSSRHVVRTTARSLLVGTVLAIVLTLLKYFWHPILVWIRAARTADDLEASIAGLKSISASYRSASSTPKKQTVDAREHHAAHARQAS